jgi:hypothetical protein
LGKNASVFWQSILLAVAPKKKGNASFYSEDRRLNFWVERRGK